MDTHINLPKPMGRVDEGQWATTMVWRLSMTNSVGPNRYRFRHTRIDAYAHRDDITKTHMCCENEKPPSVFWISGVYAAVIFIVIDDWAAHPCRHPFLVHQRGWQVRVDRSYRRIIIYIYIYTHTLYIHSRMCIYIYIYTHADTHRVMWAGVKIKCHIAMLQDDNTNNEFNIPIERKPQECLGEYPHMFHTLTLTHVSECRYFDLLIDHIYIYTYIYIYIYIYIEKYTLLRVYFFCGNWDLQETLRKLALKSHTSKKLGVLCGSHPTVFTEALCCVNKTLIRMKNIYAGLSIGYPPKFDGGSSFFPH